MTPSFLKRSGATGQSKQFTGKPLALRSWAAFLPYHAQREWKAVYCRRGIGPDREGGLKKCVPGALPGRSGPGPAFLDLSLPQRFLLDYQPALRYRHLKQMQLKTFSSSCWKRYVSVRKVFAHFSRLLRSAWSPLAARAAYLSRRRRPGDRDCGSFHRQRAVEPAVAQVQPAPTGESAAQF